MINLGINDNELSSMPIAMASALNFMGEIYPFFAPSIEATVRFPRWIKYCKQPNVKSVII